MNNEKAMILIWGGLAPDLDSAIAEFLDEDVKEAEGLPVAAVVTARVGTQEKLEEFRCHQQRFFG